MRKTVALYVCLSAAGILPAQETFEAASIKPHPGEITVSSDPAVKGAHVRATASTLVDMIYTAYGAGYGQITGAPNWANSEHYDLDAATGGREITRAQMRTMLQALLAERFQLKVHRETREVPKWELLVMKNGPKFKQSAPDDKPISRITADAGVRHLDFAQGAMAQFAAMITGNGAGRPVLDRTGLTGVYSFKLDWSYTDTGTPEVPSLFAALQEQLGLKLESTKGPVEFIVIDHAEKPTAN